MSASKAADLIVSATVAGSAERILSLPANLIARFHGVFPGFTADLLGLLNHLLPHGNERTERGAASPLLQKPLMRILTTLGRRAAVRLLQPEAERIAG